ncbi:MAG TPA: DUF4214 domain-containing protein, partial [Pirellulales bacterium]|nr:DUF4214 domain-containing protein [Pirellulales bacterium]
SAANYTFAFVNGTLSVTPATLTVTADDKSKVLGSANPPLTDTITGFVNGDSSSVVTGTATLSTTATAASGVGNDTISVAPGTLSAANYTFAFVNGTLAITQGTTESAIAAAGVPVAGYELSPLTTVPVATFTDGDGSSPAGDFGAMIDWGDGVTSFGDVSLSSGTYTVSGSHTYGDEGTYSLSVSITGGGLTTTVAEKVAILEALLPDGTRGTANQNYVQEIYRDVLHRAPDQSGLDYWTAKLDAGESHAQLAYEIVRVAFPREEQLDEVQSLYETYLHRAPEPAGLQFWAAFLYDDGTDEEMAQDLVSSPEYLQTRGGGTNDGFLDALFHDSLGRAVDHQTRVFFDTAMANGATPAQVAALIFGSEEYRRDLVSGWYEQFLDRPADPLGVDAFVGELADGQRDEQIIAELVASDEYFAKTAE